jgi:dCTP deaminase
MAVWSDTTLRARGAEIFSPFDPARVQPASYDMTLGDSFLVQALDGDVYYDLESRSYRIYGSGEAANPWETVKLDDDRSFVLRPNEFALGTTAEVVKIPHDAVGRTEGKSSLGRIGLIVHVTAGYIDPGFEGQITLEFKNISSYDIVLTPGVPIGQLSIHQMDSPAEKPYGSCGNHYQNQRGATPSR